MSGFDQIITEIGTFITGITAEKNRAYGDAVHATDKILGILYPNGIDTEQYQDLLLIVRMLDKINRISSGDKNSFGESPWNDIAGYAILGSAKDTETQEEDWNGKQKENPNVKVDGNGWRLHSSCRGSDPVPAGHARLRGIENSSCFATTEDAT